MSGIDSDRAGLEGSMSAVPSIRMPTRSLPAPMVDTGRILPLPAQAIAQIYSSKHITSLRHVVLSLLENSLDAGATTIGISLNERRGSCTVEDNGSGIAPAEFDESGGLGKMYCTSKQSLDTEVHGSTGTFLAQLASMAFVKILSKHGASEAAAASLTIHRGQVILRQSCGRDSSHVEMLHPGTHVSVEDLFGNMPVRVKQRALAGEADDRAWQELKYGIAALLVAWPRPCSVRLRDLTTDSRRLYITGQHPDVSGMLTEKSLHKLAGKSVKFDLRDALPVLFQTGMASPMSRDDWVPLSASTQLVSLKGLICATPVPSKSCQFIALGVHSVPQTGGNSDLYEVVNKLFLNSSFGTVDLETEEPDAIKKQPKYRKTGVRVQNDVDRHRQSQKGLDRHPMYVLQVRFRHGPLNTASTQHKDETMSQPLVDILEASVTAWLKRNHFGPRRRRKRRQQEQQSSAIPAHPLSRRPQTADASTPISKCQTSDKETSCNQDMEVVARAFNTPTSSSQPEETFEPWRYDIGDMSRIRAGRTRDLREVDARGLATSSTLPEQLHREGPNERITTAQPDTGSAKVEPRTCILVPSSDDFGSVDEADLLAADGAVPIEEPVQSRQDAVVTWTDPKTKQEVQINSRTGVVLPVRSATSLRTRGSGQITEPLREPAGIDSSLTSAQRPLSLVRRLRLTGEGFREDNPKSDLPWLPGFLKEWNNPVFVSQPEEAIPVASLAGPGLLDGAETSRCFTDHIVDNFTGSAADAPGLGLRLSKAALKNVRIIGQVDTKFILCMLSQSYDGDIDRGPHDTTGVTLILVDQHAASERAILEELFDSLCTRTNALESSSAAKHNRRVQSVSLAQQSTRGQSLIFEVPTREYTLFEKYREHFDILGIRYETSSATQPADSPTDTRSNAHRRLTVTHLPPSVAERCANFPALCIEMLRTELWQLADGERRPLKSLPPDSENADDDKTSPYWTLLLPLLPSKLVSMLHSRACRSAIMFNDPLSLEECEDLVVGKLSRCVFPFICAHGRTSMVPLGAVGDVEMADMRTSPSTEHVESAIAEHQQQTLYSDDLCTPDALNRWLKSRDMTDQST